MFEICFKAAVIAAVIVLVPSCDAQMTEHARVAQAPLHPRDSTSPLIAIYEEEALPIDNTRRVKVAIYGDGLYLTGGYDAAGQWTYMEATLPDERMIEVREQLLAIAAAGTAQQTSWFGPSDRHEVLFLQPDKRSAPIVLRSWHRHAEERGDVTASHIGLVSTPTTQQALSVRKSWSPEYARFRTVWDQVIATVESLSASGHEPLGRAYQLRLGKVQSVSEGGK